MRIQDNRKEEIITEIKAYLSHVLRANDCLTVYKSICDATKEYETEINIAPGFFQITMDAVVYEFLMELSRLYVGSKDDEMTIEKLIRIVKANQGLFSDSYEVDYQTESGELIAEKYSFNVKGEISFWRIVTRDIFCIESK